MRRSSTGRAPAATPARPGGLGALQRDPGRLHRAPAREPDASSTRAASRSSARRRRRRARTCPTTVSMPASPNTPEGDTVKFFTVDAVSGGGRYRVRASIEAERARASSSSSRPRSTGVDSTLHRLLLVELLVTAIVLLTMTGLGLWVVRVALRPLDAMGKTARCDRRRRPFAARRAHGRPHRGRPARAGASTRCSRTSRRR